MDGDLVIQVAQEIDRAAFDLRREDRKVYGTWARDASKRRRIALAKAERILKLVSPT
ncbi:hypothetical protein ACYOEI_00295 [Singulisphaera rosea]